MALLLAATLQACPGALLGSVALGVFLATAPDLLGGSLFAALGLGLGAALGLAGALVVGLLGGVAGGRALRAGLRLPLLVSPGRVCVRGPVRPPSSAVSGLAMSSSCPPALVLPAGRG